MPSMHFIFHSISSACPLPGLNTSLHLPYLSCPVTPFLFQIGWGLYQTESHHSIGHITRNGLCLLYMMYNKHSPLHLSNILIPSYACFPIPPVILAQAVVILKRLPYVTRKYFLWYTILLI